MGGKGGGRVDTVLLIRSASGRSRRAACSASAMCSMRDDRSSAAAGGWLDAKASTDHSRENAASGSGCELLSGDAPTNCLLMYARSVPGGVEFAAWYTQHVLDDTG